MIRVIVTKLLGATNHHGTRIRAVDEDGRSKTMPYHHGLSAMDNHYEAALALHKAIVVEVALRRKVEPTDPSLAGACYHGALPASSGYHYAFTFVPSQENCP